MTGANTGIGKYTALELARKGADTFLLARDPAKGKAAVEELKAELPAGANLTFMQLDLGWHCRVTQTPGITTSIADSLYGARGAEKFLGLGADKLDLIDAPFMVNLSLNATIKLFFRPV